MPLKLFGIACFLFVFLTSPAQAAILFPALKKEIPQAQEVGKTSFAFLFLDIYDIALYAPQGTWRADQPYALSLRYHLAIDAPDIVDRSIEEMRRQNPQLDKLDIWHKELAAFFPNVEDGTVLAALNIPGKETIFYKDSLQIGVIKDPDFGPAYLGIWLAENTSQPAMRAALFGQP